MSDLKRWTGPVDAGAFRFRPSGAAAVRFVVERTEPNVPGGEPEVLSVAVVNHPKGRTVKSYPGVDVARV